MRFDHPLIFITDTGELLHADTPPERVGGQKERVTWQHLISTYSAIADRARKDWLHTYVYLQSERNDPLSETKKVAMGRTITSSNLHFPACWYGEVRRINKHLLPIPERKLVITHYNPILYTNHKKNIIYQYKKYIIHTILVYYLLSMAMVENGVWIILILKFTKLQKITKS